MKWPVIFVVPSAIMITIATGGVQEKAESPEHPKADDRARSSRSEGLPKHLRRDELHREAIHEGLTPDKDGRAKQLDKEILTELNQVIDAFVNMDIQALSKHVHPRMVELDSSSPYRGVGKASFLEHMAHFFEPP